nr:YgdI/YgdR family lipoprotein [Yersinia ruckeri]
MSIKKIAATVSALILTFTLVTRSGNYIMHANNGRTIVADGKPKVDNDSGMISDLGARGTEQQINHS